MDLLKRLEAVEINLKQCKNVIDFRIDANTYKKDFLTTEKLLRKLDSKSIESLSTSVQNFGAYSLCNFINFQDEGIPFLMTENIRHNYIEWNIQKYVDQESHEMLYKSHCKKGQVLITMAGEYLGRAAVYDKDFICSSNQAIAKISLHENENPYILSTFLNSKHGQNQINRFRTITGQPNINMSLIKNLLIPNFGTPFAIKIEEIIKKSEISKDNSKKLYLEAENVLYHETGASSSILEQKTSVNANIKSFKESFSVTGRLDAEYYQRKYEIIIEKIRSKNHDILENIVEITKSIEPGSQYYSDDEFGLPYMRVADYNKYGLSKPNKRLTVDFVRDNLQSINDLKPQKDSILFSKDGSVGTAFQLRENFEGITSSAILNLKVKNHKKVIPEYLTLALNSKLVQLQAERDAGGSIILHWRIGEIQKVIVPLINYSKQEKIAKLIEESFFLKNKSEQLLEIAKNAVEIAIEQNEKAALAYIHNQNI